MKVSQILLSKSDFNSKTRFESAAKTLDCMLNYGVIPIVNENDTVNTIDVKFGDNDTLSAMVAILCNAKWCFLLTDVNFLYHQNPKDDPYTKPIYEVFDINEINKVDTTTKGTEWGTGGMATKIKSAQIATSGGVNLVITDASKPENLSGVLEGKNMGTVFYGKKVDSSINRNRKYNL